MTTTKNKNDIEKRVKYPELEEAVEDIDEAAANSDVEMLSNLIIKYANAVHEKSSYVQTEVDFDKLEGRQQNAYNRDLYFARLRRIMDKCEEGRVDLPQHLIQKGWFAIVTAGMNIIEEGRQIVDSDWGGTHIVETYESHEYKYVLEEVESIVNKYMRKLEIVE